MSSHLDWALWYVETFKWKIFPTFEVTETGCSCSQGDKCTSPGKHPRTRNGLLAASSDPEKIKFWWRNHPEAGIGLLVGGSGLVVVDVDKRSGGLETASKLHKEFGFPKSVQAKTGGGGYHIFFSVGTPLPNKSNAWPGIDLKCQNGFVVLPPTVHHSGNRYTWRPGHAPGEREFSDVPSFIEDIFEPQLSAVKKSVQSSRSPPREYSGPKPKKSLEAIPPIVNGSRNEKMAKVIGRLIWEDHTVSELYEKVHWVNNNKCQPPLEAYEVDKILNNMWKKEGRNGGCT